LFLGISDTAGTLTASDGSGPLPGSGTSGITLNGSYADIQAALGSLSYIAGPASATDQIVVDIWDQFGIETTGTIPVSVSAGSSSAETWTGAVSSDWNTAANWSGGAVPKSGDTVSIVGGTPNAPTLSNATLSGETIRLSGSAAVNFSNVTLDSVLSASGSDSLNIGGTLTVGSHGTLGPAQSGTLVVNTIGGTAVPIVNDGLLLAPSAGFFTINDGGTTSTASVSIQNNGTILGDGGYISFDFGPPAPGAAPPATLLNAGSIAIANGGSFDLNGTLSGDGVRFNGAGTLGLQQPQSFAGGASVTGFGAGDRIDLYGPSRGGPLAFANGILSVGTGASIPLAGAYQLGNFESESVGGSGNAQIVAYAPDNGPSGIVEPDIVAPASASVAQGSTLSLGNVSIQELGTTPDSVSIDAGSGTLFMNGGTGSGTSHISIVSATADQINADLSTLTYVSAAGATSDTVSITAAPPVPVSTTRSIPIAIGGSSGPSLHEPASETVVAGGTIAVSGSYADQFALGNGGQLFVGISDDSGTLTATDGSGNAVAGSGTSSIGVSADFVDVNAILANLHYTAAAGAGTDTIRFDVWNQAGVETTGSTSVTIGGAAMTAADFLTPGGATASTGGSPAGSIMMGDTAAPAMSMPLALGS